MTPNPNSSPEREARLAHAKAWLCKRWSQEHPNAQHVIQLADYAETLSQTLPAPGAVELPEGMKSWSGGDRAPNDWDGGPVLARSGRMMPNVASWTHPWRKAWPTGRVVGENETDSDVVAYTPTLATVAAANDEGVEKPRPFHEWHEDRGPVLWWLWPITEEPYVGSPLDLGRTVSFNLNVQVGVDLYEVEPKAVGMTGGWPWAGCDDDTEARLFWTPLPCASALDTAIRDHIRGGPEDEV